eukprot:scaffold499198_cov34-Prasinocladus_malaysianus.AAC.1
MSAKALLLLHLAALEKYKDWVALATRWSPSGVDLLSLPSRLAFIVRAGCSKLAISLMCCSAVRRCQLAPGPPNTLKTLVGLWRAASFLPVKPLAMNPARMKERA